MYSLRYLLDIGEIAAAVLLYLNDESVLKELNDSEKVEFLKLIKRCN